MPGAGPGQSSTGAVALAADEVVLEKKRDVDANRLLKEVKVLKGEDGYPIRVESLLDPESGAVLKSSRMVADRLVVGFDPSKGPSLQEAYFQESNLKVSDINPRLGLMRVQLSSPSIAGYDAQMAKLIARTDLFTFVESEYLQQRATLPNDPYLSTSGSWGQSFQDTWGLHRTGVVDIWDATNNLPTVVVAVIDSGVDLTHPEMAGKIWQNPGEIAGNGLDDDGNGKIDDVNGWNYVNGNADVSDVHGHGTAVAGVIAAVRNNSNGIAGVSSNASLMILKTSNFGASSTYDNATAIEYAVNKGAKIINMSFGNSELSFALHAAIFDATSADVVLVASAGNDGQSNATVFPANFDGVVSVGSFSPNGLRSSFSNYGPSVDLMAPGDEILALRASGTFPGGAVGTQLMVSSGTSLSAPFVAGLASIVRARHPEFTAAEVEARMKESPIELGAPGWDLETGRGGVAAAAVLSDLPPVIADILTPANFSVVVDSVPFQGQLASSGALVATLSISSAIGTPVWTEFGTTSSKSANILLGTLTSGSFQDGSYVVRLNAQSGGTTVNDYQVVTIGNDLPKITRVHALDHGLKVASDLDGDGTLEVLSADFRFLSVYSGAADALLPGWPQEAILSTYGHFSGVPAMADLDGDGTKEIGLFYAPQNNQWGDSVLEIFHVDGSRSPGWPKSFHNGRTIQSQTVSPVFADMDGDGVSEIIYVQSNDSQAIIQVVNLDGSSVSGWPVTLPAGSVASYATPAVADMDGDGRMDLAVLCKDGKIYLYHHDGTPFVNWPKTHSSSSFSTAYVVAADFDNDASLELFVISEDGKASMYESSGAVVSGWPRDFSGDLGVPAVGNVCGDNALEVAVGLGSDQHLWTASGTDAPGWPQETSGTLGMPILVDLDNDGDVDVYNTSYGPQLLAWDTTGRSMAELGFPRATRFYSPLNNLAGDFDGDGMLEISADKYELGSQFLHLKTPASGRLEHREIHMLPDRSNRHALVQLDQIEPRLVLSKDDTSARLSLSGRGFLNGTQVKLGETPLIVESVTPESLVCILPDAMPVGSWSCMVSNCNFGTVVLQNQVFVISSLLADTDGDGLTDGQEITSTHTDPNLADSNANGTSDANEDLDSDGLSNLDELNRFHSNPLLADSNSDGLSDAYAAAFVGTAIKPAVGNQISLNLRNLAATGNTLKLVGKLPKGLTFNASTGLISGIITAPAGTYPLSVQILSGKTVIKTISIPIVVLPFPNSLIGSFESLVENGSSVPIGALKITITAADAWTATLDSASGARRSAKGKFVLAQGAPIAPITAAFAANGAAPVMTFSISLNGTQPTFTGTYNGGTVRGFKIASGSENPGSTTICNLVLDPGTQDGNRIPAGLGTLKGSFSNLGVGTFTGVLGDGTAATVSVKLSTTGQAILWIQPYKNKSSYLGGIITVSGIGQLANTSAKLTNQVSWTRAADARALSYPNGFSALPLTVGSSRWSVPANATALGASLGWRNSRLSAVTLDGAGLSNSVPQSTTALLPTEFSLDASFNLVTSLPTGSPLVAWTGKVTSADGGFTGTLTLPTGFSTSIFPGAAAATGVLVQDDVWSSVTGCGLVKVPVAGIKGSFKTAAIKIGQ